MAAWRNMLMAYLWLKSVIIENHQIGGDMVISENQYQHSVLYVAS